MNDKAYAKTLEDELDWKLLDQLYGVVSQISSFCFEIKKFCITTEILTLAFIAKLAGDTPGHYLFVSGIVISICFWFLDATAYFYQVKLRGTMEIIRQRIGSRGGRRLVAVDGVKVIEPQRTTAPYPQRLLNAVFNHSMWLYALIIAMHSTAWFTFHILQ